MANIRFFPNESVQTISTNLTCDIVRKLADDLPDEDAGRLAKVCKTFHRQTAVIRKPKFKKRMQEFLGAVINDDRIAVKALLDSYPKLLLTIPPKYLVIESKYTWQKFYAEDALTMAAKLKQIKMIRLLLTYYDKLEQTPDVMNSKVRGLSVWKSYEIQNDKIIIPQQYAALAQFLIDVFKEETFPNGVPGINYIPLNIELSEQTEFALSYLLDLLVPKKAVKLDDLIDVELFLLAVCKAYAKNFSSFKHDWNKLDALCIHVKGLIRSALIPETGEICCESLFDVVTAMQKGEKIEISPLAAEHKLKSGKEFYRGSRDSREGHGYEFLCDFGGRSSTSGGRDGEAALDELCQIKQRSFNNIMQQAQEQQDLSLLSLECEGNPVIARFLF